jgi:hypothetical protein
MNDNFYGRVAVQLNKRAINWAFCNAPLPKLKTRSAPRKNVQRLDLKLASPVGINSHLRTFHEWNGARSLQVRSAGVRERVAVGA